MSRQQIEKPYEAGYAARMCDMGEGKRRDAYFHAANGEKTEAVLTLLDGCVRVSIPEGATHLSLGYDHTPAHNLYNGEGYLASLFLLSLAEI